MNNGTKGLIVLGCITVAAAAGYIIYTKKKNKVKEPLSNEPVEEQKENPIEEEMDKFIFGDNIAMMPDPVEIDKTEYATRAEVYDTKTEEVEADEEKNYIQPEQDTEDEEDESVEEMDDEVEEAFVISKEYDAYRKKNANKIIVLPEDKLSYTWNADIGNDPDNPDVIYEEEELYYFTEDETLTDEDGNIIDEEQYLGVKPRQFGWFTNDKEDIYIRNNPLERDFRVNKVRASREDYY